RGPAPEISEFEVPALQTWSAAVNFIFLDEGAQILLDLCGVLVRVHLKVTKLTSLPAERDMKIQTERFLSAWRLVQGLERARDVFGSPLRERWVIGNEIIADLGPDTRAVRCNRHNLLDLRPRRIHPNSLVRARQSLLT